MAINPYKDDSKSFARPLCKMEVKQELIGNPGNSNFRQHNKKEFKFYLNDIPTVNISYSTSPSNGAFFANKVMEMKESAKIGNLSLLQLAQNMTGSGYKPIFLTGKPTFELVKQACYLNLSLKTRIYDFVDLSLLYDALLRITLPTNSNKLNAANLAEQVTGAIDFVSNGASTAYDALKKVPLDSFATGVKKTFGVLAAGGKRFFSKDGDEVNNYKQPGGQFEQDRADIAKAYGDIGTWMDNILSNVNNYISKDFVIIHINELDFLKKIPFVVKEFNATQSTQLVDGTLKPLYMDFEISLESLGAIDSTWDMSVNPDRK